MADRRQLALLMTSNHSPGGATISGRGDHGPPAPLPSPEPGVELARVIGEMKKINHPASQTSSPPSPDPAAAGGGATTAPRPRSCTTTTLVRLREGTSRTTTEHPPPELLSDV